MIIIQLDSSELNQIIQKAVRKVLSEVPLPRLPETDQLFTLKEASDFLNLSSKTIYGYVHRQEIPVSKRGNRLYFSKEDLTQWVKNGQRKTISEIEKEAEVFPKTKQKGGKAI